MNELLIELSSEWWLGIVAGIYKHGGGEVLRVIKFKKEMKIVSVV